MLCLKDIKEQCNLTALPDTRSRGFPAFLFVMYEAVNFASALLQEKMNLGSTSLFTNLYVSGIDTGYGQRKREPIFGEKNMILSKKLRNL